MFVTPSHLVAQSYGISDEELINKEREWYVIQKMSTQDIADQIYRDTKIKIAARSIQRHIRKLGVIRERSESSLLMYSKGKMDNYLKSVRKVRNNSTRPRLQIGLRYKVLKAHNFTCKCGNIGEKGNPLQVDHIDNNRENNDFNNLQVLCRECNQGKYWAQKSQKT